MNSRPNKSVTLLELIIAIALLSVIVLGFASIELFSRHHLLTSDRRARLQNELSYTLEHMGKSVLRGIGDINNPAIVILPLNNGFRVRIDENNPPTPANFADDTLLDYALVGSTLSCNAEVLSSRIVAGTLIGPIPSPIPDPAPAGFFIDLTENNTTIEIALVVRFQPLNPTSPDNPQVVMKTQLYTRSAAAR